jgi:hypothetical protein
MKKRRSRVGRLMFIQIAVVLLCKIRTKAMVISSSWNQQQSGVSSRSAGPWWRPPTAWRPHPQTASRHWVESWWRREPRSEAHHRVRLREPQSCPRTDGFERWRKAPEPGDLRTKLLSSYDFPSLSYLLNCLSDTASCLVKRRCHKLSVLYGWRREELSNRSEEVVKPF